MKRILLAILLTCGIHAPALGADIVVKGGGRASVLVGIWTKNYDEAKKMLQTEYTFPVTIALEEGGVTVSYTMRTLADLPQHDVSVACPNNGMGRKQQCWFIKYGTLDVTP